MDINEKLGGIAAEVDEMSIPVESPLVELSGTDSRKTWQSKKMQRLRLK